MYPLFQDQQQQQDAWLASDESIGPGNSQIFDFTLVFGNSFLSILPAVGLLLITTIHAWKYSRRPKVAAVGRLYWARLVSARLAESRSDASANVLSRSQPLPWLPSKLHDRSSGVANAFRIPRCLHSPAPRSRLPCWGRQAP